HASCLVSAEMSPRVAGPSYHRGRGTNGPAGNRWSASPRFPPGDSPGMPAGPAITQASAGRKGSVLICSTDDRPTVSATVVRDRRVVGAGEEDDCGEVRLPRS